ncbi:hypothetical protein HDU96_005801 [Phlyctochytrium bullatum]|nr:hypothetical protein HDU96_005801 [Phlyctochytrium bullatum]
MQAPQQPPPGGDSGGGYPDGMLKQVLEEQIQQQQQLQQKLQQLQQENQQLLQRLAGSPTSATFPAAAGRGNSTTVVGSFDGTGSSVNVTAMGQSPMFMGMAVSSPHHALGAGAQGSSVTQQSPYPVGLPSASMMDLITDTTIDPLQLPLLPPAAIPPKDMGQHILSEHLLQQQTQLHVAATANQHQFQQPPQPSAQHQNRHSSTSSTTSATGTPPLSAQLARAMTSGGAGGGSHSVSSSPQQAHAAPNTMATSTPSPLVGMATPQGLGNHTPPTGVAGPAGRRMSIPGGAGGTTSSNTPPSARDSTLTASPSYLNQPLSDAVVAALTAQSTSSASAPGPAHYRSSSLGSANTGLPSPTTSNATTLAEVQLAMQQQQHRLSTGGSATGSVAPTPTSHTFPLLGDAGAAAAAAAGFGLTDYAALDTLESMVAQQQQQQHDEHRRRSLHAAVAAAAAAAAVASNSMAGPGSAGSGPPAFPPLLVGSARNQGMMVTEPDTELPSAGPGGPTRPGSTLLDRNGAAASGTFGSFVSSVSTATHRGSFVAGLEAAAVAAAAVAAGNRHGSFSAAPAPTGGDHAAFLGQPQQQQQQQSQQPTGQGSVTDGRTGSTASVANGANGTRPTVREYHCSYEGCHRVFQCPDTLFTHMRTNHTSSVVIQCPFCHVAFFHHERLEVHVAEKHAVQLAKMALSFLPKQLLPIVDELPHLVSTVNPASCAKAASYAMDWILTSQELGLIRPKPDGTAGAMSDGRAGTMTPPSASESPSGLNSLDMATAAALQNFEAMGNLFPAGTGGDANPYAAVDVFHPTDPRTFHEPMKELLSRNWAPTPIDPEKAPILPVSSPCPAPASLHVQPPGHHHHQHHGHHLQPMGYHYPHVAGYQPHQASPLRFDAVHDQQQQVHEGLLHQLQRQAALLQQQHQQLAAAHATQPQLQPPQPQPPQRAFDAQTPAFQTAAAIAGQQSQGFVQPVPAAVAQQQSQQPAAAQLTHKAPAQQQVPTQSLRLGGPASDGTAPAGEPRGGVKTDSAADGTAASSAVAVAAEGDEAARAGPSANGGKLVCATDGCAKTFATAGQLNAHKRTHAGRPQEIRCQFDHCGKVFPQVKSLIVHSRIHSGERPYVCPVEGCGKSFRQASGLRSHNFTHTGERPYVCRLCNKSYTTSSRLTVHFRTHTDEFPYKCTVPGCTKAFKQSSNLKQHQQVHIPRSDRVPNVRGLACGFCGNPYKTADSLEQHIRKAHPGKTLADSNEMARAQGLPIATPNMANRVARQGTGSSSGSTGAGMSPVQSGGEGVVVGVPVKTGPDAATAGMVRSREEMEGDGFDFLELSGGDEATKRVKLEQFDDPAVAASFGDDIDLDAYLQHAAESSYLPADGGVGERSTSPPSISPAQAQLAGGQTVQSLTAPQTPNLDQGSEKFKDRDTEMEEGNVGIVKAS